MLFKTLKLYVDRGLLVEEKYIECYKIDKNSGLLDFWLNSFEENFFTLMKNAVYGKNGECERRKQRFYTFNRIKTRIRALFFKCRIFCTIKSSQKHLLEYNNHSNSIVDLAKYQMYYFHFKVMRPDSECRFAARQITNCRL